jgi:(methylthio)acryloyl-CoA hydratase
MLWIVKLRPDCLVLELAEQISNNAGMTNYALMHVLPRIVESGQESGLMMESLMSAIAQDAPEAKSRVQDFLRVTTILV